MPRRERKRVAGIRSSSLEPDLAELADAIPNNEDWQGWNRLGLAFFAASNGSDAGFEAFDRWSRKSSKYGPESVRERWRSYHRTLPTQISVGSLVYLARLHGWRPGARSGERW
jgi:hypothetical protein